MADRVKLRALRPVWIEGRTLAAGEIVAVDLRTAAAGLDGGRVELVDAGDAERVQRSVREADARLCPRPWDSPSTPWRPLR